MKKVEICALDEVPVGALLAADVVDEGGRVLMPAGSELTEGALGSLRRREIDSVSIEKAAALNPAELAARQVRIETQLARLFRHAGEHAETRALHQAVLAHRLKEYS